MKFLVLLSVIAFVAGAFVRRNQQYHKINRTNIFFCCLFQAISEDQRQKAANIGKACIERVGVDLADVGRLKSGDFSNKNEKIQCFANCFFTTAQIMNGDGTLNEAVTRMNLNEADPERAGFLFEACKDLKGYNSCEKAHNLYECYYINNLPF